MRLALLPLVLAACGLAMGAPSRTAVEFGEIGPVLSEHDPALQELRDSSDPQITEALDMLENSAKEHAGAATATAHVLGTEITDSEPPSPTPGSSSAATGSAARTRRTAAPKSKGVRSAAGGSQGASGLRTVKVDDDSDATPASDELGIGIALDSEYDDDDDDNKGGADEVVDDPHTRAASAAKAAAMAAEAAGQRQSHRSAEAPAQRYMDEAARQAAAAWEKTDEAGASPAASKTRSGRGKGRSPLAQTDRCLICDLLLRFFDTYHSDLASNPPSLFDAEKFKIKLGGICKVIPHEWTERCKSYVEHHGKDFTLQARTSSDPNVVCGKVHRCAAFPEDDDLHDLTT